MINLELIKQMVDEGYVHRKEHPILPLVLYNYAPQAQFDRVWNEGTLVCRGLVVDMSGNIVARPFRKFFNMGEPDADPTRLDMSKAEVWEKLDGSLIIVSYYDGEWIVNTRGSFTSWQSEIAREMLMDRKFVGGQILNLNPSFTYMFELIHPENRIVVSYGDATELILIGVIETGTGKEMNIQDPAVNLGFKIPRQFKFGSIEELLAYQESNAEGFVLYDSTDGYRLKVKFPEYVRLHRLLTGINEYQIWESLSKGEDIISFIGSVPDEFYGWVRKIVEKYEKEYTAVRLEAEYIIKNGRLIRGFTSETSRKDWALYIIEKSKRVSAVCFAILDGREIDGIIWKIIKPKKSGKVFSPSLNTNAE